MKTTASAFLALCLLATSAAWAATPQTLTWPQLIPEGAPPPPPPVPLHDISQLSDALNAESGPAAKQQSPAAPVVQALDGQQVKLPGYIVPLDVGQDGEVNEFLLVPYYGACIHVPPPPSNQIVYVHQAHGVKMDELYQPYWVVGRMQVKHIDSDLAQAGYQLKADEVTPYEYEGE
ncbi:MULTISPECIES: DUF3299 domain-containing protein [Pseudomonas]|jgi:hypothetical protein|uniref:DUF3299 domain-containing protein n=1 Tax=Pseudomonas TaxID=286 RepID=UPI0002A370DD|nr:MULTISPECIES: DUF3299 domain-containing protein [Pseudomonas]AMO74338.1 hypothetical protein PcP3B5_08490 [Pseudomonas citronellolis]KWR84209.1 hypothetical protein RN02_06930 [Pseudomonas sp. PI1]MBB1609514.1 hypothetical protein [Pseudomonas sp. UMC76]MBB1639609.1 hypothetical protein [Pseudomonas sp. UME83]MCP1642884.1 hypothetical protein [Pseudomonas citronellolis]